jgi:hypothetical protein
LTIPVLLKYLGCAIIVILGPMMSPISEKKGLIKKAGVEAFGWWTNMVFPSLTSSKHVPLMGIAGIGKFLINLWNIH